MKNPSLKIVLVTSLQPPLRFCWNQGRGQAPALAGLHSEMEQANTYEGRSGQLGRQAGSGPPPCLQIPALAAATVFHALCSPLLYPTPPTCILNHGPRLTWALLEHFVPHPLNSHCTLG